MRVLYVCGRNPWSLRGGALIRNYWLVRALAERHEVELVTADAAGEPVPPEFAGLLRGLHRFGRPSGLSGKLARIAGALRPSASYYVSGLVGRSMRQAVRERSQSCDIAVIDVQLRDALLGVDIPYVYNAHNCEAELVRRRAAIACEPARTLLNVEARRLATIEAHCVRHALLVAACSDADRTDLLRLAPQAADRAVVVPNGVDAAHYAGVRDTVGTAGTILVTGSFDWQPNRAGLEWLLARVVPALRARLGAQPWTIRVAGRMDAALATALVAVPGIEVSANPPDMRVELSRAQIVCAPVLASSGTRLRILEAWAAGRPVLTTPDGAFGLDAVDGREAAIAADPEAFAQRAADLIRDPALRARIRRAALERVPAFEWRTIGSRFLGELSARTPATAQRVRGLHAARAARG
jgi:glycosyltransferase involved in cell wall biosynthesis